MLKHGIITIARESVALLFLFFLFFIILGILFNRLDGAQSSRRHTVDLNRCRLICDLGNPKQEELLESPTKLHLEIF